MSNSIQEYVPFLYPVKMLETQKFSDIFKEHKERNICVKWFKVEDNNTPAGNYMFKGNNRNTRTRREIYLNIFHTLL